MIKVGIIGGAGYTAGELLRILINHPNVKIEWVHSRSQKDKFLYAVHTDLLGETNMKFSESFDYQMIDVVFLCSGHGESRKFLHENSDFFGKKIIDLSTDFRDESQNFVYGLPEFQKEKIKKANYVANPGCFATAIQLGLLPLAKKQKLNQIIHINALTGSTGAGQSLSETNQFSWRSNNISVYKAFTHQHLTEIRQTLSNEQAKPCPKINFIPYRGNFTRGIFATIQCMIPNDIQEIKDWFSDFYEDSPFVWISEKAIDTKQVINTNKCFLHLEKQEDELLITSILDNLLKGASGQAVQNMNLLFGLEERTGLRLKSVAF